MTSAHRPTFDPARGKEALRGPAFQSRYLPAYTKLKVRQPGQGGTGGRGAIEYSSTSTKDLRAELFKAEAAHIAKKKGIKVDAEDDKKGSSGNTVVPPKRRIEDKPEGEDEDEESKRRRIILEEARGLDADSVGSDEDNNDDDDDDSSSEEDEEDETAQLMAELEKIKRERAEQRAQEEAEKALKEQKERDFNIAQGNPLLNNHHALKDSGVKRRWDDDVVFKNQARGTEEKKAPEFINDLLRSDFHKKFMNRTIK